MSYDTYIVADGSIAFTPTYHRLRALHTISQQRQQIIQRMRVWQRVGLEFLDDSYHFGFITEEKLSEKGHAASRRTINRVIER